MTFGGGRDTFIILDTVAPTVEVTDIITPVYNFRASKPVTDEETMDGVD